MIGVDLADVLDIDERRKDRLPAGVPYMGREYGARDDNGAWRIRRSGLYARPELLGEWREEQQDQLQWRRDQILARLDNWQARIPVDARMSSTPAFAVTPRQDVVQVVTANTARDGSGTIADCLTGGSSGTKIDEYGIQADNDPADSVVTIFIYGGASYRIWDEFDIGNPAAASNTVTAYREFRLAGNLYVTSNSKKFSGAITVALTAGNINLWAQGADL